MGEHADSTQRGHLWPGLGLNLQPEPAVQRKENIAEGVTDRMTFPPILSK